MKIYSIILGLIGLYFVKSSSSDNNNQNTCSNPLNMNINPYNLITDFISSPKNLGSTNFCKNLNGRESCCNNKMITETQQNFDQFKRYFNAMNADQARTFDQNIRTILLDEQTAFDSIDTYNDAMENIEQTQQALEVLRDNLPTIEGGENSFNITDDGTQFDLTVDDEIYTFTGEDIDEYFDSNANMLRDVIDALDDSITALMDLEIFEESNFIVREKVGDHYKITIDKELFTQEFQLAQERIREHIPAREKCFTHLTKFFGANRCLQCEPDHELLGIDLRLDANANVILHLNRDTCTGLIDECYDFVETSLDMNQNAILYVFVESIVTMHDSDLLPEEGQFDSINETNEEIAFLTTLHTQFALNVGETTFFIRPPDCEDQENCEHLCQVYIESTGVDINKVFSDNIETNVEDILIRADEWFDGEHEELNYDVSDADDDSDRRRTLQFNELPTENMKEKMVKLAQKLNLPKNFQEYINNLSDKFFNDRVQKKEKISTSSKQKKTRKLQSQPEDYQDSDTIYYRNNYQLNPFVYSEQIGGSFKIEGASGVKIFNYTGTDTYQDLLLQSKVQNKGGKVKLASEILQNFISLVFFICFLCYY